MSHEILEIRIFLSYPMDVHYEALAVQKLVDSEFNRNRKICNGALVTAHAWNGDEGAVSFEARLTPQQAIERSLPRPSECDVVIGTCCARLGTPITMNGKRFESGFAYELMDALKSKARPRPELYIYRKHPPREYSIGDNKAWAAGQNQYEALERFLGGLKSGGVSVTVNEFKSHEQFIRMIRELLKRRLPRIVKQRGITLKQTEKHLSWIGSPYLGLSSFEGKHSSIFFGRQMETDALLRKVRGQRFTAVVGASGSGKSSLVKAGLIPWLEETSRPEYWVVLGLSPDSSGSGNPFIPLANHVGRQLGGQRGTRLQSSLRSDPNALLRRWKARTRLKKARQLLVFVDQFEELLTTVDQSHFRPFVDMLVACASDPEVRIVVTLRSDFLEQATGNSALASLLDDGSLFVLAAAGRPALNEMITMPADRARIDLERGLPERIVDDTVPQPGGLALMSFTLAELYDKCVSKNRSRRTQRVITAADYEKLGGVAGAVGRHAQRVERELRESRDALPDLFSLLVDVDAEGTPIRKRVAKTTLRGSALTHAVERLEKERLLTSSDDPTKGPILEIAHEALFHSWRSFADWIRSAKDDLILIRRAEQDAQRWTAEGRGGKRPYGESALLWSHEDIQSVKAAAKRLRRKLSPRVRAFLQPETMRLERRWDENQSRPIELRKILDRVEAIGWSGVPLVVRGLDEKYPTSLRGRSIQVLKAIADREPYNGTEESIRASKKAVDALARILRKSTSSIAARRKLHRPAIVALGKIGSPECAKPLHRILVSKKKNVSAGLKKSTVIALKNIDPVALGAQRAKLVRALKGPRSSRKRLSRNVRAVLSAWEAAEDEA